MGECKGFLLTLRNAPAEMNCRKRLENIKGFRVWPMKPKWLFVCLTESDLLYGADRPAHTEDRFC